MEHPLEIPEGLKDRVRPELPDWYQWIGMGVPAVLADIIIPLSFVTIPLIPVIVLIEVLVFWLIARKAKVPVGFLRLVLATFAANIATSVVGTLIPLYRYTAQNLIGIGIAFVVSVLVEWRLYVLFFRKTRILIPYLLKVSFLGNLITYAIVTAILLLWA